MQQVVVRAAADDGPAKFGQTPRRWPIVAGIPRFLAFFILVAACVRCCCAARSITTFQPTPISILGGWNIPGDIQIFDYDRDGWDDFLIAGDINPDRNAFLYHNDAGESFTMVPSNILGLGNYPGYDWSAPDPQGRQYLAGCGLPDPDLGLGVVSYILSNNADRGYNFTEVPTIPPLSTQPVYDCDARWGDYNNDGYPDLLMGGLYATGELHLYTNMGNGTFVESNTLTNILARSYVFFEWADYDRDGYLDFFYCGKNDTDSPYCGLYRNQGGTGTFAESTLPFVQLCYGDMAWGDYNNDGWPDILVTGATVCDQTSNYATVYRNNMGTSFTDINPGLVGCNIASVDWGDFDNDGFKDIFISGQSGFVGPHHNLIYRNIDGSGVFQLQDGCNNGTALLCGNGTNSLPQTWSSQGRWFDYDKDGFLDLLLQSATSVIYRNVPITPPVPLVSTIDTTSTLTIRFTGGKPDHVLTPIADGQQDVNKSLSVEFPLLIERTPAGMEVRRLELDVLNYTTAVTSTSNSDIFQFSSSGNGTKVFFLFNFFRNATSVQFGGNTFSLNGNTAKWSISIAGWPFSSQSNILELHVALSSVDGAFTSVQSSASSQHSSVYTLSTPNTQVLIDIIDYALNGYYQIPVNASFAPDLSELLLSFPYFASLEYDPNFSVVITPSNNGDGGDDTDLALLALISIIIPVCFVFTLGVGVVMWVVWMLRNRRLRRLMNERHSTHVNFGPNDNNGMLVADDFNSH